MKNFLKIILGKFLTNRRGNGGFYQSREISTRPIRETPLRPSTCPYCASKNFVKRGWRMKKLEKVQLLLCNDCHKTFTPQITKGKHYPLATIFDAVSLYNLGYSLEESCRIIQGRQGQSQKAGDNETGIGASTLSNWLSEFKEMMPYGRLRDFAIQKYTPKDAVITATLAHRQLYRFRFHRAKCQIIMQEHFHHSFFKPLREFLEMVPSECPHQYFQDGLRASETPLIFSKTAMIVRGKTNFATKTADFVLQSVKERTQRHEAMQKFMLYNDSVTVATEVPVYLTGDDLEHMKTQLGFEIYQKENSKSKTLNSKQDQNSNEHLVLGVSALPKLITGHIDILQIRNGMIHILDYKPNAEKERPIEQLTLYAMALSRLTGLRLFEFKCAWFDEKDYFEFYPLHVLHKTKRALRRRKVETKEGTYKVNKDENKIKEVKPYVHA